MPAGFFRLFPLLPTGALLLLGRLHIEPADERAGRLRDALKSAPDFPYLQMALGRVLAETDWHNLDAEGLPCDDPLPRGPEARHRYADWCTNRG
jgi:hypothetical protein